MARPETGTTTRIFQLLAFVGIGAFLYWLYVASEPTEFLVAEEEVEEIEAIDLTPQEFLDSPMEFEGERVRLADMEVAQLLRQNVYFFAFGEERYPVLVRIDEDVAAEEGFSILPGDRGELIGALHPVDEELIENWNQAGVFEDAEELLQAQTQAVYLFATWADIRPPEEWEEEDEEEADEAQEADGQ